MLILIMTWYIIDINGISIYMSIAEGGSLGFCDLLFVNFVFWK